MRKFNSNIVFLMLLWIIVPGCSTVENDGDISEAKSHAIKIYAVNEQIVNVLNDVFYFDVCIESLTPLKASAEQLFIYFPEANLLIDDTYVHIDRGRGMRITINTNGESLRADGTSWIIDISLSKLWGNYEDEECRLTISNESDYFSLKGQLLTNRLYERGYFYSDINLNFNISATDIQYFDPSDWSKTIYRRVPIYEFYGMAKSFFGDGGVPFKTRASYDVYLSALRGYDHKQYIGRDPIYDESAYFVSGEMDGNVYGINGESSKISIVVNDENNWTLKWLGKTETFNPNNNPLWLP